MEMFFVCMTCIICIADVYKTFFLCCYWFSFSVIEIFLNSVLYIFFDIDKLFVLLIKGSFLINALNVTKIHYSSQSEPENKESINPPTFQRIKVI